MAGRNVAGTTIRRGGPPIQPLTIVHTSDLGEIASELAGTRLRIFPRIAGLLRTVRPDILTDGGDTLPAVAEGEPGLAWLATMGYTAWVPGNHDMDLPASAMIPAIQRFGAPVVAANLVAPGWTPPGHIVTGGGRVAIVGLTRAGDDPSWTVADPVAAAVRAAAELREQVDTLILLSHRGADENAEIVRAVGAVDLALSGHLHQALPAPLWIGDTPIVQVGANGQHVGFIRGGAGNWGHELLTPEDFPPDVTLVHALQEDLLHRHPGLGEVMTDLPSPATGRPEDAQWPLADWAADAVRDVVGADAALLSRSAVEPDWTAGPITYGDICNLYHHDEDPLVMARFELPALVAAIEELANARFFAVSGLAVTVDGARPEGHRVIDCRARAAGGYIQVAMTRHQARFARPASCAETGLTVRDALATAARRHVRLIPPTDRRIALIGGMPPRPNWGHTMR